jgi:DNA-binding response OmpR family regulator
LIEDDPLLALGLTRNLQRAGAEVTICSTLHAARLELGRKKWAVVILDQMLPDGDGLEIIERISGWAEKPAVVAVSANLQNSARSLALQDSNAVLLPKPFSADELLAAIGAALGRRDSQHEALANRPSTHPPPNSGHYVSTLEFGPISLGLVSQTVHVDGVLIDLQPTQFRILAKLMVNVGRPLPVTELVEGLRGTHQDGTVNIRFQIHGLRRRLGARGALIETCPGGYGIGVSSAPQNTRDTLPGSNAGKL